jgi:hypothetical protein
MSIVQDIIQIKIKQTTWADKSLPFLPGNNLNLLGHHLESVQQLPQHSRLNVSLVRPLLSEENQSYQHSPSTSHTWDQTMSWSTPKMGMPKVNIKIMQAVYYTYNYTTNTSIRTECAPPEEHLWQCTPLQASQEKPSWHLQPASGAARGLPRFQNPKPSLPRCDQLYCVIGYLFR